jgi:glycosyltransferase involved in cell wall biosynthesis
MRILWICGSRIIGGAERSTLHILDMLRERGHISGCLCPQQSDLRPALNRRSVPSYVAQMTGSMDFRSVPAIGRAVRDFRPDVVLVTTPDEWVWSCFVPRHPVPARLILVRHMALPLAAPVRWLAGLRADAVVAVSEAVRASLVGGLGIRRERIHVIPNPVRFPVRHEIPTSQQRADARMALGLPASGRWIGFFGGTDQLKGLGDLCQAVHKIRDDIEDCRILVCGRMGPEDQNLAQWAAEFGMENSVHYLGNIEAVDVAMAAVDAVAIPTRSALSEGLPLTALEAMACGTPVVGYATGGIVEALGRDNETGLQVTTDDPEALGRSIKRLLTEPELAGRLATAALARAREHFDPRLAADRYEGLFSALMEPRNSALREGPPLRKS